MNDQTPPAAVASAVAPITGEALRDLAREAMLAWNPRLARIRPGAAKIAAALHTALKVS